MTEFSKKLFEYADTFGENFPTFDFMGSPEIEIMTIIDECLRTGKPYSPKELGEDTNI